MDPRVSIAFLLAMRSVTGLALELSFIWLEIGEGIALSGYGIGISVLRKANAGNVE